MEVGAFSGGWKGVRKVSEISNLLVEEVEVNIPVSG